MNNECTWTQIDDSMGAYWDTSCKKSWVLDEGSPYENDLRFCPFCGKVLVELLYTVEDDESIDEDEIEL